MGKWAKRHFGKEQFGSIGIVAAGTSNPEYEKRILSSFDSVLHEGNAVYHTYLASKGDREVPIVFNVYGAPAMLDVLAEMYDGGCRTVLFVGYAYGGHKQNLDIGSYFLANKAHHFEGAYPSVDPSVQESLPDADLLGTLRTLLSGHNVAFVEGNNISVPSVTYQLPHANEAYTAIGPATVEMELSACYARAADLNMRAASILIISDNREKSIGDRPVSKYESKCNALELLVDNLDQFDLPVLADSGFSIDAHLASVIDDPDNENNVYQN